MITVYILILLITIFALFFKNIYKYWAKRGIPYPEPTLFFGNVGPSLRLKKPLAEVYTDIYRNFPNDAMVGAFKCFSPILMLRDPNLVKDVTVKYFNHFQDNDLHVAKDADPILAKNLFTMKGEEWKKMKSLLTPSFTSGKMKSIFPLMLASAEKIVTYVQIQSEAATNGLEAKTLSGRFTMENVASCAFGLEGNCFADSKSEFLEIGNKISTPNIWTTIKVLILFVCPYLSKVMSVTVFPKEVQDRILGLVNATLDYRRKNNVERNDYLQIMTKLKDITDFDIACQAGGFMIDGYETSAATMSFVLFELAQNPDIQEKLRNEINKRGNDTYESLIENNYLDAVLSEAARKHPLGSFLSRTCTEDHTFTIDESSELKTYNVTVKKGDSVILPVHGLQMDPKYYPEPEKFDPSRFMPENKDNLTNYTYLPFGVGPRSCLGQRFGVLQIKVGVASLVKHFRITLSEKTKSPWEYDPGYPFLAIKGGIWVNLEKL